MDTHILRKLSDLDALVSLRSGAKGVRVSLQYKPRLNVASRSERREILSREFRRIAENITPLNAEVNLDSLSVSGQTVEACLPVDNFDEIVRSLETKQIRADVLFDRQVVYTDTEL